MVVNPLFPSIKKSKIVYCNFIIFNKPTISEKLTWNLSPQME